MFFSPSMRTPHRPVEASKALPMMPRQPLRSARPTSECRRTTVPTRMISATRAEALRITAGELVAAASAGLSSHGLEAANGASGELDAETPAAAAQPAQMD